MTTATVRVNLLRPEEFRHQGAVSKSFAVRAAAWGGGALGVLLLLIGLMNQYSVSRQLASSRETWEKTEPRYNRVRLMQNNLNASKTIWNELQAWNRSRVEWHRQLRDMQRIVPADVQLTRLQIKAQLIMIPEGPDAKEDEVVPARQFQMMLDGQAAGERADEVVVEFVNSMRSGSSFDQLLEHVKLQGMQRINKVDGEENERLFGIEGMSEARPL